MRTNGDTLLIFYALHAPLRRRSSLDYLILVFSETVNVYYVPAPNMRGH